MAVDRSELRRLLLAFEFRELFESLGWDRFETQLNPVEIDGFRYTFAPVRQKRELPVVVCSPNADGSVPNKSIRAKIEQAVRKQVQEHLIIFVDAAKTTQIWQWTRRDPAQPIRRREQTFTPGLHEEALIQRLVDLDFPIELEEDLTLSDVTGRMRSTFDRNADQVTRRFYDRFKTEQQKFQSFIEGITDAEHQRWYASVMLNRLMFVYFIQKKGFLGDGDVHYLRNRLDAVQRTRGDGEFHSFYRRFLIRLFHHALSNPADRRDPGLDALVGKVPYLNGGLFDVHHMEREYPDIDIPDDAFKRIFDFFDEYNWHLDDRPLRNDNEINPDVLGHIFEKYVNQKQMGAYYTKEDITEYIGKNTIVPFLFDSARKADRVAFDPDGAVWRLLREEPDRYIYPAVRKGIDKTMPDEIAAGIAVVSLRRPWNRPADDEFALPTEIWREHVARRQRYDDLFQRLVEGEITEINELITYNLDIRQFANDVIESAESPDLIRAFWKAINKITVLDPTCGSGAFLFAALNILTPLYEACLDRMAGFVEEADAQGAIKTKYGDFREVLKRIKDHPNRRYYVLKSIILNNLYGVDIMEEAVEICKLRLFLKLVSTLDSVAQIEPLPDIDFNIRAGNTLVGFARLSEAQATITRKFDFEGVASKIDKKGREIAAKARLFRQQQDSLGGAVTHENKTVLRAELNEMGNTLNGYLASEYGIDRSTKPSEFQARFSAWRNSHQPFHWFVDFHEIMEDHGGFDVILGNPPYVENRKVDTKFLSPRYQSESCGNLYAMVIERSISLASKKGRFGMIVPTSATCTDGYAPIQRMLLNHDSLHVASFSDQRGKLFDIPHPRLCIITCRIEEQGTRVFTTGYTKIDNEMRDLLFERIVYNDVTEFVISGRIPRFGSHVESSIYHKLSNLDFTIEQMHRSYGKHVVYYTRKMGWYVQISSFVPQITDGRGQLRDPSELKEIRSDSKVAADFMFIALNSNLFYWFVTSGSDCRNLNRREVFGFPSPDRSVIDSNAEAISGLADRLGESFGANSEVRAMQFPGQGLLRVQCMFPARSRAVLDEVDRIVGDLYGFDEIETDYLGNFDAKYRVPIAAEEDE